MPGPSPLNTFATADDRATAYAAWATRLKSRTDEQPQVVDTTVTDEGDAPLDWSVEALFASGD